METDKTPNRSVAFEKELAKRINAIRKRHISTSRCKQSRWPYTDELTPQDIACLRDSYCGHRKNPTCVDYVSNYDRINRPVIGYDQRLHKDTMFHKPTVMKSARDEETTRRACIEVNMTYGRYRNGVKDFTSLMYPRESICHKQFTRGNGMRTLPPLSVAGQPRSTLLENPHQ